MSDPVLPPVNGAPITTVSTPATPTKLMSIQTAAHPIAILILAIGGAVTVVLVAAAAFTSKVDAQTLLAVVSTFFGFLGGVMGLARSQDRQAPQRATDVTTTTTGPSVQVSPAPEAPKPKEGAAS